MAASFHGSYSEVLSRIPPKDLANISNYNISFKGKLIENVKAGSCYETAVKFSLIAETGNGEKNFEFEADSKMKTNAAVSTTLKSNNVESQN